MSKTIQLNKDSLREIVKQKTQQMANDPVLMDQTKAIIESWQNKQVEFYEALLTQLLGRDPDLEKDNGRLTRLRSDEWPAGHYQCNFDDVHVGTIIEVFEPGNMSINFIPVDHA